MTQDKRSTMEGVASGRTIGSIRCLNCFERLRPTADAKSIKCPHCSFEWRLWWVSPDVPRIRGPVWDVNRQLSEEAVRNGEGGNK